VAEFPADARNVLTILVVDDDAVTRKFVQAVLEKDGFRVLLAKSGEEGLRLFQIHSPDLVLTDYSMPGMSGAELTRRIRTFLRGHVDDPSIFIPIVVFTAMDEPALLKECLDAGAVEFLTKPFNGSELLTRIRAIADLAKAHAGLVAREAEEQAEISVVKHVLSRLMESTKANLPAGFAMETLPTRRINGDMAAYCAGAPGVHVGILCDPMGHGLMAGISEIPTMDVFNAMAARDLPLSSILKEVNRKLVHLLPMGRFSCVTLFRLDLHSGNLSVANAAMPDAFVFHSDGTLTRFPSTYIPLGIQKDLGSTEVQHLRLRPGDCFFACSDGLTDIMNEATLLRLFQEGGEASFPGLLRGWLDGKVQDRELMDDVSWCLWPFQPLVAKPVAHVHVTRQQGLLTSNCSICGRREALHSRPTSAGQEYINLRLSFHPEALSYQEVGPNLVGLLGRQGVPDTVSQTLAVLLSEAIMNAVEHGALALDSALKESGFEAFEAARQNRLAERKEETVDLQVLVHQKAEGAFSHVEVQVWDSGLGFDWREQLSEGSGPADKPHGRGLILLKSLARDLDFNEAGNRVSFSLYASET
jgi:CheY-like chemotaxis protein/anti-sigma regulatory factor (Ser/Thr protein kinase)